MSFKIIALEILESCNSKHSKILLKNHPYVFYKNYEFKNNNTEIFKRNGNIDLYSKGYDLNINISAIVGKNGSGKSTIIELIIKAINNFFYSYKDINPYYNYHITEKVDDLYVNLYFKINDDIYKLEVYEELIVYKTVIKYELKKANFDKDSSIYSFNNSKPENIDLIKNFFYSEVINYSHYAYNSYFEGNWINKIFHKNDSYQTPIVINPKRENGNIDINVENDLINQRLLANLFRYDINNNLNLEISDNLKASFLRLDLSDSKYYEDKSINDFKVDLSKFDDTFKENLLNSLFNKFYKKQFTSQIENKILSLSKLYLLYKFISICNKYEEYQKGGFYDFSKSEFIDLDRLIDTIHDDNSHITFKIRQTLNYLNFAHIPFVISKKNYKINELVEEINNLTKKEDIINFLPPPVFRTDIILKSNNGDENISFNSLSSGEKQLIYSTNSIYYHLFNINSVHNSHVDGKIKYSYVNIILEEIELYFHPELQRQFINRLISGIKKLPIMNIQGVNFIFVTHSPFILSDIPNTNIMYLENNTTHSSIDNKKNKKSFASNIHHLLGDSFFFENNIFIGEFVHNKIKEIISFIKEKDENTDLKDIQYIYNLILLIDEPILKNKLTEMFTEKFSDFSNKEKENINKMMVKSYAKKLGIENIKFE